MTVELAYIFENTGASLDGASGADEVDDSIHASLAHVANSHQNVLLVLWKRNIYYLSTRPYSK